MASEITPLLSSGQLARLIPTVNDSKKEERATSTLLASFMVVPAFAMTVLSDAGASIGKRSKIKCYTEVVFKSSEKGKNPRPDGLIVINNGSNIWTALLESKIGNAELTNEQVEEYLALAKLHNINAVITISNQFATTPTHHPLKIQKSKTKFVELYHFSWLSLKSKAVLLTGEKGIDDPEQAYILSEIVRYLDHDYSGITALKKMPSLWKELCNTVQNGGCFNKNCDYVIDSVSGWHQLLRHLALNLSMAIHQPVSINLTKQREKDAELNFIEDCNHLVKFNELKAEFNIPNAASRVTLLADVTRKIISISMKVEAPKDRSRATASINWITKQLKNKYQGDLSIKAYWPKRIPVSMAPLGAALEDPAVLVPANVNECPTYLEVFRIIDMGARFKGSQTFIEDASKEFPKFYHDAGQYLTRWVAKAPKIKEQEPLEVQIPTILSEKNEQAGQLEISIDNLPQHVLNSENNINKPLDL